MKKCFVIMVALLLAVPALSYAGSATSRFDMTIGGAVNFNFGWSSQNTAQDSNTHGAARESSTTGKNISDNYGNVRYGLGDSNFNFTVRGPDAFGAKTMGYLRVDFRGSNTGNVYGGAQIQYGFVRFDWKNSYLLMGQAGAELLDLYSRNFIIAGDHSSTSGIGGGRHIQIAYRYNITKNFNFMLGLINNTGQNGSTGNNNGYGRSGLPAVMTEVGFKSDACGKIGNDMLQFGLGAIGAREKKIRNTAAATTSTFQDKDIDVWMLGLRGYIPIIPEKKGNKTNAMYLTGIAYIGQNVWPYLGTPAPGAGSYFRGTDANGFPNDVAAPTVYGGMLQLTYYMTDNVFANAQYGVLKNNYSSIARSAAVRTSVGSNETDYQGVDRINQLRVYSASVFYDPSASVRLGVQWIRYFTNYNGYGGTPTVGTGNLSNIGTEDSYKGMVMYFF